MKFYLQLMALLIPALLITFSAIAFLFNGSFAGAIFMGILFGGYLLLLKLWATSRTNANLKKLGATLEYRYKNLLGIDIKGERVFAFGRLFGKDEIRSVETSSILETKSNGWGFQFHKDKHCKLIIHTRSLAQPILAIPFDSKAEMEEWYSRIGVFCNLS